MLRNSLAFLITLTIFLALVGCSSTQSNPVAPVEQTLNPGENLPSESIDPSPERTIESERILWGLWEIHPDFDEMKLVVEPMRNLQKHYDITNMVLPPQCNDCVSMSVNSFTPATRILDIDVTLRNPSTVGGKDVRGILHTNEFGHLLTNGDSWTAYWDLPGGDEINPFQAYATDQPKRIFAGESEDTQNYLIYIPIPPKYNQITFAVDGNWPGNCKEPYSIENFVQEGELYPVNGATCGIQVDVLDWQDDVDTVKLILPEITGIEFVTMELVSGNTWGTTLINNTGAGAGDYDAKIIATSVGSGLIELINFGTITIIETDDPIVVSIDPPKGDINESIVGAAIGGSNFLGPCEAMLRMDALVISTFNVDVLDSTSITCDFDIPSDIDIGLYDVIVVNVDDKVGTGMDLFEVQCPAPIVDLVEPASAKCSDDLTGVVITGSNFIGPSATVMFNLEGLPSLIPVNVVLDSETQITCDLNIPYNAAVGLYDVEVTNDCGASGAGVGFFGVTCPIPVIDSVEPQKAEPGAVLTDMIITGSNFISPDVAVWLAMDGEPFIPSDDVFVVDSTILNVDFTIPMEAKPGFWNVEVENGCLEIGTAFDMFEIVPPPQGGWAQTWGGPDEDKGYAVAADDFGNSYVTGSFKGTADFDPGPGVVEFESAGSGDGFLCKYSPDGFLQWVRVFGGTGGDIGYDVAVGFGGYVYVTGYFSGTVDFDLGGLAGIKTSAGSLDVFLLRISPDGYFDSVEAWGSTLSDVGYALILDDSDNLYVTGVFTGTVDFDPDLVGVDNHTGNGGNDTFVSKFTAGGGFAWARTWGGTDNDAGNDVAVDPTGNVYVTGHFKGDVDFDPDAVGVDWHNAPFNAWAYESKLDSDGNHLWTNSWGAFYDVQGTGVTTDSSGNSYVTGVYSWEEIDLDPDSVGVDIHATIGNKDMFLSKFDENGDYVWGKHFGGVDEDTPFSIEANDLGDIYITGFFTTAADLDPDPVGEDSHIGFGAQVFVSKFATDGSYVWGRSWGFGSDDHGKGVATNSVGDCWVTGFFRGTVDFNPDPIDEDNHTSAGYEDISLSRFPPDGNW